MASDAYAMNQNPPRVFVVMPAFNVARTLEQTYWAVPEALRANILLGGGDSAVG